MTESVNATSATYQEQFNKQLSQQLKIVRQKQPNHIPVYSMKYKNASKYFIQDLKQPLALFPKKFKLTSLHQIIQKQSIQFCLQKLKDDKKVKDEGTNFKLPKFYMYTISMLQNEDKKQKNNENDENSQNGSRNNLRNQKNENSVKPIGKFVKLDLQMTFEQAFNKYGRHNVLTVVYTDARQVRQQYNRAASSVQKWLTRIIIFILILVLIPFLMKSEQTDYESINQKYKKSQKQSSPLNKQVINNDGSQMIDSQTGLDIDIVQSNSLSFKEQRTIEYDQDTI